MKVSDCFCVLTKRIPPFLGIVKRTKSLAFRLARRIPYVANQIKEKMDEIEGDFKRDVEKRVQGLVVNAELPIKGISDSGILELLDQHLNKSDYDWKHGRVSGSVYRHDQQLVDLLTSVYGKTSYTNPLHPDIFPGVCKIEAEVVQMTLRLFNGGSDACGTVQKKQKKTLC